MWQLTCTWRTEALDRTRLAGALLDLTTAWQRLTRCMPVWHVWRDDAYDVIDATRGRLLPAGVSAFSDWAADRVDIAAWTFHSATPNSSGAPVTSLEVDVRCGASSVLRWSPLDLTADVTGDASLARNLLLACVGSLDVDTAVWQRTDLLGPKDSTDSRAGWMVYGAPMEPCEIGADVGVLRGVLVGPSVPAEAFGPQEHRDSGSAWMTRTQQPSGRRR